MPPQRAKLKESADRAAIEAKGCGAVAATWCRTGAPAGMEEDFDLSGVFPQEERSCRNGDDTDDPDDLETDHSAFVNYEGFDEDTDAVSEVHSFWKKGYLKRFETLEETRKYLGRDPILSRFGCITKTKDGRTKKRIILDLKQSRVTKCTKKAWRTTVSYTHLTLPTKRIV